MTLFKQPPSVVEQQPYIFEEGEVFADYPVGQFVVDSESGQSSLQVIQICELEGKLLVAVPHSTWNRAVSQRVLPYNCLSKPTLIEVQAALSTALADPIDGLFLKVWVGFLKDAYRENIEILEEFDVTYWFDSDHHRQALPYAQGLVEMVQEHFAFFSAEGTDTPGEAIIDGEPIAEGDAGVDGLPMTDTEDRLARMEKVIYNMGKQVENLLMPKVGTPKRKAAAKSAAKAKRATRAVGGSPSMEIDDMKDQFPLLDPGVAAAALQAGIPVANLQEMQKLLSSARPRVAKTPDLNPNIQPRKDPLSEGEDDDVPEVAADRADGGLVGPKQNVSALDKLASIVEILAEDRLKKASQSKLEVALDGGSAPSTEHPLQGTGKKAAAARRALRSAYQDAPDEVYNMISKLMYEDINSTTLPPGIQARSMSARSWVEHRSRITSHKTGAFASWGVAGILDSLNDGDLKKGHARAAVLLMCLDQASIDAGSWTLASEIFLEPPPPFGSLNLHRAPQISDGELPFSRLLDQRWAEVALAQLKETDEYLVKRKTVGKFQKPFKDSTGDESVEPDPKRRPRPKAKQKSQAAPAASEV